MNTQLLTAIALERMTEAAREAEARRRARPAAGARRRNGTHVLERLRGRYLNGGHARNVEPVHRAAA
jgi:hypothetical protein